MQIAYNDSHNLKAHCYTDSFIGTFKRNNGDTHNRWWIALFDVFVIKEKHIVCVTMDINPINVRRTKNYFNFLGSFW